MANITAGQVLEQVDALVPNQYTHSEKLRWLAAVSGCGFDYAGEDGHAQPSSLNGLLGGLELAEVESYLTTSNGKGLFLAALH